MVEAMIEGLLEHRAAEAEGRTLDDSEVREFVGDGITHVPLMKVLAGVPFLFVRDVDNVAARIATAFYGARPAGRPGAGARGRGGAGALVCCCLRL